MEAGQGIEKLGSLHERRRVLKSVDVQGTQEGVLDGLDKVLANPKLGYESAILKLGETVRGDLNTQESNITAIKGILDHYAKTGGIRPSMLSTFVENYIDTAEFITELRISHGFSVDETRGIVAEVLQDI